MWGDSILPFPFSMVLYECKCTLFQCPVYYITPEETFVWQYLGSAFAVKCPIIVPKSETEAIQLMHTEARETTKTEKLVTTSKVVCFC